MRWVMPIAFALVLIYALFRKVNVYDGFVKGAKDGLSLAMDVFPYLAVMFVMIALMRDSGLSTYLCQLVSPVLVPLGIPQELTELVLLRPFSGSGSLALLNEIMTKYGADSYVSRCASVMMSSTETVFYISAVYFASTKIKKIGWALPIALLCNLVSCVLACWLCKVM